MPWLAVKAESVSEPLCTGSLKLTVNTIVSPAFAVPTMLSLTALTTGAVVSTT